MGKLRDQLNGMNQLIQQISDTSAEVMEQLFDQGVSLKNTYETAFEGCNTLYTYLDEKFRAINETYAQHSKDTLATVVKTLNDTKIITMIQKIDALRVTANKFAQGHGQALTKLQGCVGDLDRLLVQVKTVAGMIEKKRKKLFQSANYKGKLKIYDNLLDGIKDKVAKLKKELVDPGDPPTAAMLDNLKLTASMTLEDLEKKTSTFLKSDLKKIADSNGTNQDLLRKVKEAKLPAFVAEIKRWANEADDLEKEAAD